MRPTSLGHRSGVNSGACASASTWAEPRSKGIVLAPDGRRGGAPARRHAARRLRGGAAGRRRAGRGRWSDQPASRGRSASGPPGSCRPGPASSETRTSRRLNGRAVDRDLSDQAGTSGRVDNDANCFVLSEATDGAAANRAGADERARASTSSSAPRWAPASAAASSSTAASSAAPTAAPPSGATPPCPSCAPTRHRPTAASAATPTASSRSSRGAAWPAPIARSPARTCPAPTSAAWRRPATPPPARPFGRYEDRLARALAGVINLIDPRAIVLGGGVSNNTRIFDNVPRLWTKYTVADDLRTALVPARHGDASGVRGAACLWPV